MKKKLKVILPIIVILLLISIGIGLFFIYLNNEMDSTDDSKIATEEDNEIVDKVIDLEQNNIAGTYSDINIMDIESAKKSIENVKDKIGINSIDEEFQVTVSNTNGEYINTYKFQQMYKGIEVYSGELIVYTDKHGKPEGIINKYNKIPADFNVNPVNSDVELQEIVLNTVNNENAKIKNSKLIIYYLGNQEYILAYEYTIETNQEESKIIVADESKKIIDNTVDISTVNTLTLTKEELDGFVLDPYNSTTYNLKDNNRHLKVNFQNPQSGKLEAYMWSISNIHTNSNNVTVSREDLNLKLGYDTLTTVQKVYDYYKEKFNLNSVKGNEECWLNIVTGATVSGNSNYSNNAFWDLNNMIVYGADNLYNYDIETTAHEYLHGVMQYKLGTKNEKDYQRQILEEAYGDILGMCAESHYSNTSNIDGIMNIINRNIKDANLVYSDLPKSYKEFIKDKKANKDEHYYSVILSKVAYLMSQKLTVEELEQLWFNSIDLLTEREATFNDCYYAIVRTSQLLDFSEEKQNTIKEAFESLGFGKIEIYDDKIANTENTEEITEDVENNLIENNTVIQSNSTNQTINQEKSNSNSNKNNQSKDEEKISSEETKINTLTKDQAIKLIQTNFKDWKGIQLTYQYSCKVKDSSEKEYYAINTFSPENYYNYGGEWLEEVNEGKYYAGTYYVSCKYSDNIVNIGKNERDWSKYKEGDTIGYFMQNFRIEVK